MNEQEKEKKNLFLPKRMLDDLKQDAVRFEAFGPEDHPVMNQFISCLLLGYIYRYREERKALTASIRNQLQAYIKNKYELDEQTALLLDSFSPSLRNYEQKGKMEKISYKPTNATYEIIQDIERSNKDLAISLPQYLRSMFASYLSKPIYERERIIFSSTISILEKACKDRLPLILSSASDPTHIYHVVPYMLTHSSEEMFNYLICQGHREPLNPQPDDKPEPDRAYTFRICRIVKPREDTSPNLLKPEIEPLLNLMNERSPQYPIDEDFITKVLLTKDGIRAFSRIFFGRPKPIQVPEEQPDGSIILTFNHSFSQLYFYFRRFAANEALVLEPKRLADEIKAFHEDAWKAYKQGKPVERKKA